MSIYPDTPVALTIAGSDSGGGAGIQADLLTFVANGVFGTSAITCLTAQNPDGVTAIHALPATFVREQIEQVQRFFRPGALKTGMLYNAEIIFEVADFVRQHPEIPLVVDPVMVATSGAILLEASAIQALCDELLPRACLVTPNLDEAAVLLEWRPQTLEEMDLAAGLLQKRFGTRILLKGGHLESEQELVDVFMDLDGNREHFTGMRIYDVNTHGSGCTLSSAIAANLARGWDYIKAIGEALSYLRGGMRKPLSIDGQNFIQH